MATFDGLSRRSVTINPLFSSELRAQLPSECHRQRLLRAVNEVLPQLEHVGEELSDESEGILKRLESSKRRLRQGCSISMGLQAWKRYRREASSAEPKRGMAGIAGDRSNVTKEGGWVCVRCESGNDKSRSICEVCEENICFPDASSALDRCRRRELSPGTHYSLSEKQENAILLHEIGTAYMRSSEQFQKLSVVFGLRGSSSKTESPSLSPVSTSATHCGDLTVEGMDVHVSVSFQTPKLQRLTFMSFSFYGPRLTRHLFAFRCFHSGVEIRWWQSVPLLSLCGPRFLGQVPIPQLKCARTAYRQFQRGTIQGRIHIQENRDLNVGRGLVGEEQYLALSDCRPAGRCQQIPRRSTSIACCQGERRASSFRAAGYRC